MPTFKSNAREAAQKIEKRILCVADPGCLSRIPDPDFTHPGSRISDPKTATKERDEKKFVVIPFL
jgi:hypothetical protein